MFESAGFSGGGLSDCVSGRPTLPTCLSTVAPLTLPTWSAFGSMSRLTRLTKSLFALLYALIGVMTLAQADRYPVMADNSRVSRCELIRFSFDLRPGNRRRFGIERQRIPEIFLVRFHCIGLNGVFLDSRACSDISVAWGEQVLHGTGHDWPVYDRGASGCVAGRFAGVAGRMTTAR